MLGIYNFVSCFEGENLYTRATSFNSFGTLFIPEETLVHTIGRTSKAVIKTGRELRFINIIAINMKEATGVAFTALIIGVTRISKKEILDVIMAIAMPINTAIMIPKSILKSEFDVMLQNSEVFINLNVL